MIGNWLDTLPCAYRILVEFAIYIVSCFILLRLIIVISEFVGEKIISLVQRLKNKNGWR